jgi:hypothetical protein
MDQEKLKQLDTELASAFANLRNLLSQAQATTGAMDVFIYQMKKELIGNQEAPKLDDVKLG